MDFIDTLCIY